MLAFVKEWERTSMVVLVALTLALVFILVPLAQDWRTRTQHSGNGSADRATPVLPPQAEPPARLTPAPPRRTAAQLRPSLTAKPAQPVATASVGRPGARPMRRTASLTRPAQPTRHVVESSPSEQMARAFRHAQGPAVPLSGEELRLALVADASITRAANERQLSAPGR